MPGVSSSHCRTRGEATDCIGEAIIQLVNNEIKRNGFHWIGTVVENDHNIADLQILIVTMSIGAAEERINREIKTS